MGPAGMPIQTLPAWALLNGADLSHVLVQPIQGKGYGIVARHDILGCQPGAAAAGGDNLESAPELHALLKIPHDCVLSAETVEGCAKINPNFRQLLESTGYQTAKAKITLFLLTQIVLKKRGHIASGEGGGRGGGGGGGGGGGAPLTPWTEYVKFLPDHVPLPTMWSVEERQWLAGTSLESALRAKLSVLVDDFSELRKISSDLPFWHAFFWENDSALLEDWILADALYRSRCLELPSAEEAMVPVLDMANHSSAPSAYCDEDPNGHVFLSMLPGHRAQAGQEITISYGAQKPAAEMLFSYGFVDPRAPPSLTLPLDPIPGDPLAKAKLRILGDSPTVRFWQQGDEFKWESPSAHLLCLNEEDGLDFGVLQHTSGERELRAFWQGEDVTDRAQDFQGLAQNHPLSPVFKLRVVVILLDQVTAQAARLESHAIDAAIDAAIDNSHHDRLEAANMLQRVEAGVLRGVLNVLESEKATLLSDAQVLAYLESMEDVRHDENLGRNDAAASGDEEDFS